MGGPPPPCPLHLFPPFIPSHIPGLVGAVAAPCEDGAGRLVHQDAADGDFLAEEGGAGLFLMGQGDGDGRGREVESGSADAG